ncbi:probable elongation factor 1-delta isoform X1 [Aethina tumida]|uniref:probable elongation factor 1-delta isoform X1 n=1 Tax=Aethina tumida TaxID=116153 RepID=UPI00096AF798|nr:probable elongation factor 1-delta isoform X1 [Aethina tumida]
MKNLTTKDVWISKPIYDDAETRYYEGLAKASLTPLANEVAKTRQRLIERRDTCAGPESNIDLGAVKFLEKKVVEYEKVISQILEKLSLLENKVGQLEKGLPQPAPTKAIKIEKPEAKEEDDDDDVDLFGSDSEGENDAAAKLREERLAAYAAKKAKKPALIAKSNVIFDVKPWDDETDMKAMEENVKKIEHEGLLWGASKLVPLAYGIHKLQISCVVEDDKVSIDWLQEQIEANEDYVQSVDIAAFNKI